MTTEARKITITGRVQGVGYRPFVYNRANELGLTGTVLNGSGKVFIFAEGSTKALDQLESDLVRAAPPLARPQLAHSRPAGIRGFESFNILASDSATEAEIHVPPDLFTCDDCLQELTGPEERRFGYPFINCTQCGPRYTIITAMPYDRPNTSMAGFPLCDDCRAEYESPSDRRFHAQPLACPVCGPQLEFVTMACAEGRRSGFSRDSFGDFSGSSNDSKPSRLKPLLQAIDAIKDGQVVAIKGVGGYHLVCDASSDEAVKRLRRRKHRPDKPLAVMFPLRGPDGLDALRLSLELDPTATQSIVSPERPIVLARKRKDSELSPELAPGLNELGAFLPYSPLHHELLDRLGKPIVATSGNISGEPVITDNTEVEERLATVADAFLHHNRPIVRPADDPVIRPMAGRPRPIRLGRGIAPLELSLPAKLPQAVLATGGHMKNTVALAWDERVVISPHIGDLDSVRSNTVFNNIINDIQKLYDMKYDVIVCDLHPRYSSTRWADTQQQPVTRVQHHAAHASSLAGEHPDVGNWLIFTWDGVGYGSDGSLWGGEALAGKPGDWQRVASFRPFRLVGGDKAGREPWRSAAALLWTEADAAVGAASAAIVLGEKESRLKPLLQPQFKSVPPDQLSLAHNAWKKNINTFETSAAGRLFDAAAALVLGRELASFEGQGPMELEHIAAGGCAAVSLPLYTDEEEVLRSDWQPLPGILSDTGIPASERAGIFHETMAQALVDQALAVRENTPFEAVGLSGGVFQNRRLTERVVELLEEQGIDVRLHEQVPANDGGLCFGQVIEALALKSKEV
jgi:hydrogenase maturation protein HypF